MTRWKLLAALLIGAGIVAGCSKQDRQAKPPGPPSSQGASATSRSAAGLRLPPNSVSPDMGTLLAGTRRPEPSGDTDTWRQFRGNQRDNIAHAAKNLPRSWPAEGPKPIWTIEGLAVGYNSVAINGGKVYFNDYDTKTRMWMTRCVWLADGQEVWRWSYRRGIIENHGITRSVPVVDDKYVVSLDPKCVLHGYDAVTGKHLWAHDLAYEYGTTIPGWYNGQCPLDGGDRVVIGVGGQVRSGADDNGKPAQWGKSILMAAFRKDTGELIWQTPNAGNHEMTHSSVMPVQVAGRTQYVWCTNKSLVGVDSADGRLLWELPWQTNTAVAPSAFGAGANRVFMTAGYKAGSILLDIQPAGDAFAAKPVASLTYQQFESDCHTPVLWQDRLYDIDMTGLFTCLSLDAKVLWKKPPPPAASASAKDYGLGSFLLADGMFFVLEGATGRLHMLEPEADGYKELASAAVLAGKAADQDVEAWAPMAYANGKLVLRNLTKMVCIQIGQ